MERIPPPTGRVEEPLKAFLFDSLYDKYRGVISLVNIQGGTLRKGMSCFFSSGRRTSSLQGDRIASCYTKKRYEVAEVGIMHPEEVSTGELYPGISFECTYAVRH